MATKPEHEHIWSALVVQRDGTLRDTCHCGASRSLGEVESECEVNAHHLRAVENS